MCWLVEDGSARQHECVKVQQFNVPCPREVSSWCLPRYLQAAGVVGAFTDVTLTPVAVGGIRLCAASSSGHMHH